MFTLNPQYITQYKTSYYLSLPPSHPLQEPMPYNFRYGVKDDYAGTDFGQQENSDGNAVQGSYNVVLPDGRIQTVSRKEHVKWI